MKSIIENWEYFAAFMSVGLAYFILVLRPALERNRKKIIYQSLAEPRIFWDNGEADYWERYKLEARRFMDSGNNWAKVQVPLIPYPRNAYFEIEWMGKKQHYSTIGLPPDEYARKGVLLLNKLKAEWDAQFGAKFGMDALMKSKGQEFDDDETGDIWENFKSEIKHN